MQFFSHHVPNTTTTTPGERSTRNPCEAFRKFPPEKSKALIDLLQRFCNEPISAEYCEIQDRVTDVEGEQIAPTMFTSFKFREYVEIIGVSKTTLRGALNYVNKLKSQLTCSSLEETNTKISMWNSVLVYVMKILQVNWYGKASQRALQNFKFIWPRNFIEEYRKIIPIGSPVPFNRIQPNTLDFKICSNNILLILDSYNRIYDMMNSNSSPSSPIQLPGDVDFRYNTNKSLFYSGSNSPPRIIKVQLGQPQKEFGNLLFEHPLEFKSQGFISSSKQTFEGKKRLKDRKLIVQKQEIEKVIVTKKDFTLYRMMFLYWWFEDGFWERCRQQIRADHKSKTPRKRKKRKKERNNMKSKTPQKRKQRKKERNNRKSVNISELPNWKKCNLWFTDKTNYRTKPTSNLRNISNIYKFEEEWHFVEHADIQSELNLKERKELEKQRPKRGRYNQVFYDLGQPPKKRRKLNDEGDEEVDSGKEGEGKKIKRKKKKKKKKKKERQVTMDNVPVIRSARFY